VVAGSDLSCLLWLDATNVAPRHAEFVEDAGVVAVRPIPPAIITVNGQPVTDLRVLSDGDTVGIGEIRIRYRARIPWWSRYRAAIVSAGILVAGGLVGARWIAPGFRSPGEPPPAAPPQPEPESPHDSAPSPPRSNHGIAPTPPEIVVPSTAATDTSSTPHATAQASPAAPRESWVGQLLQAVATAPAPEATQSPQGVNLWTPKWTESPVTSAPTGPNSVPTSGVAVAAGQPSEPRHSDHSAFEQELNEAERALAATQWIEASNLVARVPTTDAGFARACRILAYIAEQRGDLSEAERWWTRVLSLTNGGRLYNEAVEALVRIAQANLEQAPPPLLDLAARTWTTEQAVVKRSLEQPPPLREDVVQALTARIVTARSVSDVVGRLPSPANVVSPTSSPPAPMRVASHAPDGARLEPALAQPGPIPTRTSGPTARVSSAPSASPGDALAKSAEPRASPRAAATAVVVRAYPPTLTAPLSVLPRVTIEQISVTRFPDDARWDELRLVEVVLRLAEGDIPDVSRVELEAVFFDRNETATVILPTRVAQGGGRIRLSGPPWHAGETRRFTLTYTVPAGGRARDRATLGFAMAYHGLRLRVYVNGQLTDEAARPTDLPRIPPAIAPSAASSR